MLSPQLYGLDVNKGTAARLSAFAELVHGFTERAGAGARLRCGPPYNEGHRLMLEYTSDSTPENVSKLQNLEELLKAVDTFEENARETRGDEATGMSEFLAEISLMTDQDTDADDTDSITMMTIHAAKGLEFECVFVVGVEEELLPSAMSMHSASEIEEERRLMYVALTRAKRFCMVSYARQRAINGKTVQTFPSRFLRDIEPQYLRLMTGSSPRRPPQFRLASRASVHRRTTVGLWHACPPQAPAPSLSPATAVRPAARPLLSPRQTRPQRPKDTAHTPPPSCRRGSASIIPFRPRHNTPHRHVDGRRPCGGRVLGHWHAPHTPSKIRPFHYPVVNKTDLPTPYFIVYEDRLRANLSLISDVARRSGAKIIMAFKANALWRTFPIIREYVRDCTASLCQRASARRRVVSEATYTAIPAYIDSNIDTFIEHSSHITFNSLGQLGRYGRRAAQGGVSGPARQSALLRD